MAEDKLDWLGPVLGFVGLLAGTLFMSGQQSSQNNNNNSLPPPPMNKKPGGCGCNANKS